MKPVLTTFLALAGLFVLMSYTQPTPSPAERVKWEYLEVRTSYRPFSNNKKAELFYADDVVIENEDQISDYRKEEDILAEIGRQGWELIAMRDWHQHLNPDLQFLSFYMKRPAE